MRGRPRTAAEAQNTVRAVLTPASGKGCPQIIQGQGAIGPFRVQVAIGWSPAIVGPDPAEITDVPAR
jgi:hypothetical protein